MKIQAINFTSSEFYKAPSERASRYGANISASSSLYHTLDIDDKLDVLYDMLKVQDKKLNVLYKNQSNKIEYDKRAYHLLMDAHHRPVYTDLTDEFYKRKFDIVL